MTTPTHNPFAPAHTTTAPVTLAAAAPRRTARPAGSGFERRFLSERYRGGAGMLEVAALWRNNVIAVDSYREASSAVTIGADQATYLVEAASVLETTALVEPVAGRWVLHVGPEMDGFVVAAGRDGRSRRMSFDEAVAAGHARRTPTGYDVTIAGATRARVTLGEQSFLLHYVSAPALRLPLVARVGLAGLALAVMLSLGAHLFFGVLVSMSTDRVEDLSLDRITAANRYGETLVVPEAVEPDEQEKEIVENDEVETEGEAAMSGNTDQAEGVGVVAEGASRPELGRGRGRGNQGEVVPTELMQRLDAINSMATAGEFNETLVAWNQFDSGDVMKPGGYVLGPADAGRIGGRDSINLPGPIDTGRRSRVDGPGDHPIDLNTTNVLEDVVKETRKPDLKPGRVTSSGTLTARQIRKIIGQHKRELTGLYGKELARDKALHGKIVVSFIIDGTGNVVPESVQLLSSSMNNATVERGLVKMVKRLRFPSVRGGGMTKVTYPFVFDVK